MNLKSYDLICMCTPSLGSFIRIDTVLGNFNNERCMRGKRIIVRRRYNGKQNDFSQGFTVSKYTISDDGDGGWDCYFLR